MSNLFAVSRFRALAGIKSAASAGLQQLLQKHSPLTVAAASRPNPLAPLRATPETSEAKELLRVTAKFRTGRPGHIVKLPRRLHMVMNPSLSTEAVTQGLLSAAGP